MLNVEQRQIARKILYAVETGGQIYGHQRYEDYTEAYTNSTNEHSITIGAGAWYATQAQKLLQYIQSRYPDRFKALDTVNLAVDLVNRDWTRYQVRKTEPTAQCIINIIGSPEGIICQDSFMEEQIIGYEKSIENSYGTMSAGAMLECINIRHQGGMGALKRILSKTQQPYTEDTIYQALCTDPLDTSSSNQVGDYITRQKKVYNMIKTHLRDEGDTPMGRTAQSYIQVMQGWIGYSEANGKHREIIDLYNSHKPLARGYAVKYTDAWCDTTISAAAIAANMVDLIGTECGCEKHIEIFKEKGIWVEDGGITPKPGYIILYNWDSKAQPNDGWADHIGVVESVANGQIVVIEGNKNDAVSRRVLSVGNGYIRGYATPRYDTPVNTPTPVQPSIPESPKTINKKVAWYGTVNTAALNVRVWAGIEYGRLRSYPIIKQNTRVGVCDTILDKENNPWYYVKISGDIGDRYGFVSATYITKLEQSIPDTFKDDGIISKVVSWRGKVTASVLNVRTWAGTNNPKIKSIPTIKRDTIVEVCDVLTAADGSKWYYIKIDGRVYGFVHSNYISKV